MAITSEFIGSLNQQGYVFLNETPKTYDLPKFPAGVSITTTRWNGSKDVSYDLVNKDTGEVWLEKRLSPHGHNYSIDGAWLKEHHPNGFLLRFNTGTPVLVCIVPNLLITPPVWNG